MQQLDIFGDEQDEVKMPELDLSDLAIKGPEQVMEATRDQAPSGEQAGLPTASSAPETNQEPDVPQLDLQQAEIPQLTGFHQPALAMDEGAQAAAHPASPSEPSPSASPMQTTVPYEGQAAQHLDASQPQPSPATATGAGTIQQTPPTGASDITHGSHGLSNLSNIWSQHNPQTGASMVSEVDSMFGPEAGQADDLSISMDGGTFVSQVLGEKLGLNLSDEQLKTVGMGTLAALVLTVFAFLAFDTFMPANEEPYDVVEDTSLSALAPDQAPTPEAASPAQPSTNEPSDFEQGQDSQTSAPPFTSAEIDSSLETGLPNEVNPYLSLDNPLLIQPGGGRAPMSETEREEFRTGLSHRYPYQRYLTVLDIKERNLAGSESLLIEALELESFWARMRAGAALADFGLALTSEQVDKITANVRPVLVYRFLKRFGNEASPGERHLMRHLIRRVDDRTRLVLLKNLTASPDDSLPRYLAAAMQDPAPQVQGWISRSEERIAQLTASSAASGFADQVGFEADQAPGLDANAATVASSLGSEQSGAGSESTSQNRSQKESQKELESIESFFDDDYDAIQVIDTEAQTATAEVSSRPATTQPPGPSTQNPVTRGQSADSESSASEDSAGTRDEDLAGDDLAGEGLPEAEFAGDDEFPPFEEPSFPPVENAAFDDISAYDPSWDGGLPP